MPFYIELLLIALLILANGLFAMSEMAVVSSRKARLQQMANRGDAKARAALELANHPDRFLSTVQIGITLVGILAGAFGGATLSAKLSGVLSQAPFLAPYSGAIALGIVVVCITYLSLIFGELAPKRIALSSPERVAAAVAGPMRALSVMGGPFVHLLSVSTAAVFKGLGIEYTPEPPVTEEEINVLIEQGANAGVFEKAERDMVKSVLRLADRKVSTLMTPRVNLVWIDVDASLDEVVRKVAEHRYARYPVCRGNTDNVVGVIVARDFLAGRVSQPEAGLDAYLRQPLFVPETASAMRTLEMFKTWPVHVAMVVDEYGSLEGMVTTSDILEAIVGDVASETVRDEPDAVQREDGSWLLDGGLPIEDVRDLFGQFPVDDDERGAYETLAGFIMARLGRIPAVADAFEWHGLRFEVVDMDGRRIDRVLVTPKAAEASEEPREPSDD